MPLSDAKKAAYAKVDEAVDELIKVFSEEDGEEPGINIGWVMIAQNLLPEKERGSEDDENFQHFCGAYMKRGMNPILAYGMVQDWIRHFDRLQEE